MHANCSFSINLKGESSQEERRGREENGKREGKGCSKCSLSLLSYLMFSFTLEVTISCYLCTCVCLYMVISTFYHVPFCRAYDSQYPN
jgi:hypothetical protein